MLFEYKIRGKIFYHNKEYNALYIRKKVKRYKKNLNKQVCKNSNIVVGIYLDRGIEYVICVLACLELGITFLPFDKVQPLNRIRYMITNADVDLLITDEEFFKDEFNTLNVSQLNTRKIFSKYFFEINEKNVSDVSYILYTSGTTGLPKGVAVKRTGFRNQFLYFPKHVCMPECKRIIALSSFSFDVFFLETVIPLYYGMAVVLADDKERNNPRKLCDLLIKYNVDILQSTPSRLRLIHAVDKKYNSLSNIKSIFVGGEPFPIKLLEDLKKNTSARIFNVYGPTETTIWATVSELTNKTKIDIGKSIENVEVYVWDEYRKNVRVGECGEVVIGGIGVAKGYINNPDETNKRFIFDNKDNNNGVYLTGDIGRYDKNGNLLYVGRKDNQIKYLGNRIELEEIDNQLEQIEGIDVGISCFDKKRNRIIAFIKKDMNIDNKIIYKKLSQNLPKYMIPQEVIEIENMLYTSTGKIDRKMMLEKFVYRPKGDDKIDGMDEKIYVSFLENVLERKIDIMTPLDELNFDSILFVELMVQLEEEYNIEFDAEKLSISEFNCIKDIYEHIKSLKKEDK